MENKLINSAMAPRLDLRYDFEPVHAAVVSTNNQRPPSAGRRKIHVQ